MGNENELSADISYKERHLIMNVAIKEGDDMDECGCCNENCTNDIPKDKFYQILSLPGIFCSYECAEGERALHVAANAERDAHISENV